MSETAKHQDKKRAESTCLIEAIGLSKYYGVFTASKDVSFKVHERELVAFLGPNGAGKSTTMNMLTGYLRPSIGPDQSAVHKRSASKPATAEPTVGAARSSPAPSKMPCEMSVAAMLAAARFADSGGDSAAKPAESKPAPVAAPAASKKPSEMSVAEMLAAARAEKDAAKKRPKPAPKPVAKKAAPPKYSPEPKPLGPKDTSSILAAARSSAKPGPITKAEAAARVKETGAEPAKKKKLDAPPMPAKPDYAKAVQPASESWGFLIALTAVFASAVIVTSSLAIGFSSLAIIFLLWTLGLARFMFPNILTEPPTRFKVGFPGEYARGQVATKNNRSSVSVLCATSTTDSLRFLQNPVVRTWVARRTGWKASRNSNAPATAAVFIRTVLTSKVPRRDRWSGLRFVWPTMGSWKLIRVGSLKKKLASGRMPPLMFRCN